MMEPADPEGVSPGSPETSPIIFLDTNAVHYTRLALALAQKGQIKIADYTLEQFNSAVNTSGIHNRANNSIINGYHIGRYLAKQIEPSTDARVYYAPVSGFELLCGGLRGRAILNAARCGVPHRWYSKLEEAELLHHLTKKDFDDNYLELNDLPSLFQGQLGFPISEPKEADLGRIFSLAQVILGTIYLELGDCLVYASALLARASQVITSDSHLRDVILGVQNPGSAKEQYKSPCREARNGIQSALVGILGIEEDEVIFPKASDGPQLKKEMST